MCQKAPAEGRRGSLWTDIGDSFLPGSLDERAPADDGHHDRVDVGTGGLRAAGALAEPVAAPALQDARDAGGVPHSGKVQPVLSLGSLKLEAAHEGLLRAVPAGAALRCGGRLLYGIGGAAFRHSVPVQRIDEFWSHSWSAPRLQKVATLLVYYNSRISVLVGLFAVLCSFLAPSVRGGDPEARHVPLACGMVALLASLALWWSQRLVFLDKACIVQDHEELKRDGIRNLGFFLRRSRRMLVLWDPSYFTRLWCIFELAAKLKLLEERGGRRESLHIRPVVHGPVAIGLLLLHAAACVLSTALPGHRGGGSDVDDERNGIPLALASGLVPIGFAAGLLAVSCAYWIRLHVAAMGSLRQQLRTFTMAKANCYCCSVGHVDPQTNKAIECDRMLVEASVADWFGSTEAFDACVQSHVKKHVFLRGCLPYRYVVFSVAPRLFQGVHACGLELLTGQLQAALVAALACAVDVLVTAPVTWSIIFTVFERAPPSQPDGQGAQPHGRLILSTLAAIAACMPYWVAVSIVNYFGAVSLSVYAAIGSIFIGFYYR